VTTRYRNRVVLTNPPPSAGGILIAYVLALLDREMRAARGPRGVPAATQIVAAMAAAHAERTPEFLEGLSAPGFSGTFLHSRLGATTHVSVLDDEGWACSMTTTNGEGSGVVVPGTGIHVNNMLGEADLSPLGFLRHPPGRRLPSMMAPTIVLRGGVPELVVGSAGSNRIRSAVLQVVLNAVDGGMDAQAAVDAPRVHLEDGRVYVEPGIDVAALEAAGHEVAAFSERNLFFGGAQAAELAPGGGFSGGGDPRRGGAVVYA
jgi:gamma-glutamyltranspeptidase / glutathione hydrolase